MIRNSNEVELNEWFECSSIKQLNCNNLEERKNRSLELLIEKRGEKMLNKLLKFFTNTLKFIHLQQSRSFIRTLIGEFKFHWFLWNFFLINFCLSPFGYNLNVF